MAPTRPAPGRATAGKPATRAPRTPERPVIAVKGLWTEFDGHVVHRGLDMEVDAGEILALVGGSGSGKTTLLRQMVGLERPSRGSVEVFGFNLRQAPTAIRAKIRKRWGVLFQEGALYSALPVYDNLALPLRELRAFDEDFIRDLVLLKLDMVDIERRHADRMPSELSGGMVKRVALARALVLEPELLFLDEPTAGLDPDRSESFVTLLASLRERLELTVVMVTHDLDTLVSLADRVAVLFMGELITMGTVPEVVRVDHPFIHNFFGGERGQRALSVLGPVALAGN
ncbi:MAG: ATP-binding cassette domain-containing protein [Betaproteobacteria bacterium]|jgi:phospholipid/cholesterol/gamma-HCH transport system ATP-binding protein|nr:ATP-binding cassette domain-containing protein [Betaproteobacteria bacterium]